MSTADENDPSIHRPIPRRPYDLPGDISPTTVTERGSITGIEIWPDSFVSSNTSGDLTPSQRSRSVGSLTTSTLFGIYGKMYADEPMTPALLTRNNSSATISDLKPLTSLRSREEEESQHHHRKHSTVANFSFFFIRVLSLFVFGVAYGVIVTHLHDRSTISPTKTAGVVIDIGRWSPRYLVFWGLAGVGLGNLLPWLDAKAHTQRKYDAKWDWNPAVRSIGAFVGIAYAIRRLPWQSTLQVSLALALVNPFLWFVVDRTRSGFWFASLVGVAGTAFLLHTSPDMIKTPATTVVGEEFDDFVIGPLGVSVQSVAVGTWIASVLFCSCVCFGNIGRKLAAQRNDT